MNKFFHPARRNRCRAHYFSPKVQCRSSNLEHLLRNKDADWESLCLVSEVLPAHVTSLHRARPRF
jgi:hypothetical protein